MSSDALRYLSRLQCGLEGVWASRNSDRSLGFFISSYCKVFPTVIQFLRLSDVPRLLSLGIRVDGDEYGAKAPHNHYAHNRLEPELELEHLIRLDESLVYRPTIMSTQVRCISGEEAEIAELIRRLTTEQAELEKLEAQVDEMVQEIKNLAKEEGAPPIVQPLVDLDAFHAENSALLEQKKVEIETLEKALLILQSMKS
ncbi:hypothetical protein EV360DRAFT_75909 [Lentinula raphanica]|nr:hypothetical protein EV360DRAFT_75909 [Lentinula raphanica]